MSRQHAAPLPLRAGKPAFSPTPLALASGPAQIGEAERQLSIDDPEQPKPRAGRSAAVRLDRHGRRPIQDSVSTGPWSNPAERERAIEWRARRANDFVNVVRPRLNMTAADLAGEP